MQIKELEEIFKSIFKKSSVKATETVYEKIEDSEDLRLIISIHNLIYEEKSIIHTKFIFITNKEKTDIIKNTFTYLYDINCQYHSVKFNDDNLEEKITDIFETRDFGPELKQLSVLLDAPTEEINSLLQKRKITNINIYNMSYDPKFIIVPCEKIDFDFKLNLNGVYDLWINISKEKKRKFQILFKWLDQYDTVETENLKNLFELIIDKIDKIFGKLL